jgi:hypothetical protein
VLGEHGGLFEGFLGRFERAGGVFHGLPGVLVAGLVIFFAVMRCGDAMSVRRHFMKFRCSDVRVSGHQSSRNASQR